jgi:GcrA cell cycle regulator
MEWTDDVISRLKGLWTEGHSTAEIGRRLGVSKNAVVGKAHRLDLPARPSPIRRDESGVSRPRAPKRVNGPTLPPLTCTREPVIELPLVQSAPKPAPASPVAVAPPRPAPVPRLQPATYRPYARVVSCSWPIGEPGTRSFRFCDAQSVPGKPYCEAHVAVAYVRIKDKREDAA